MAKLEITLEVDTTVLFDTIAEQNASGAFPRSPLEDRLLGLLLTGAVSHSTALGLCFYGIAHTATKEVPK